MKNIDKLTINLYHKALTNGTFVGSLEAFNGARLAIVGTNPSQVKKN